MAPLIQRLGIAAFAAVVLAGCSAEPGTAPTRSLNPGSALRDQSNEYGYINACKLAGPANNYSFHLNVQGGGFMQMTGGPDATFNFNGVELSCAQMAYADFPDTWVGKTATVTMSETNFPAGTHLDSVHVYNSTTGLEESFYGNNVQHSFIFGDRLWFKFYNSQDVVPPPPTNIGNQGCTPGYWKVKQHWDSWAGSGYTTTQLLSTVFTIPATYVVKNKAMGGYAMVDGLSFQGGSTVSAKAEILLRAAVAAVLNTGKANVAYAMTNADVISQVNAALASGNATTILNLATKLDGYNNGQGGCPLN